MRQRTNKRTIVTQRASPIFFATMFVLWLVRFPLSSLPPQLLAQETISSVAEKQSQQDCDLTAGVSYLRGLLEVSNYYDIGFRGQGVKIAIMDWGFGNFDALTSRMQNEGYDISTITRKSFYDDSNGNGPLEGDGNTHGTAVLEMAYNIAPEALLYAVAFDSAQEFVAAVDYLISEKVDVITFSGGFFEYSFFDGSGPISNAAINARANDILWVNAVGNDAWHHYSGKFLPGTGTYSFGGVGDRLTLNKLYQEREYLQGDNIRLTLIWNEWPEASSEFQIELYREGIASPVAVSEGMAGSSSPLRDLKFTVTESGEYYVRIEKIRCEQEVDFELFGRTDQTLFDKSGFNQPNGSVVDPAVAMESLSVGAVREENGGWTWWVYSSIGPTNGGLDKPELMAPTNVCSAAMELKTFPGTSASAPLVAGAAALILSQNRDLSPDTVQVYLQNSALDIGDPGYEGNEFGFGLVRLQSALLVAPNGGEVFEASQWTDIRWESRGDGIAKVQLEFSADSGTTWTPIAESLPSTGSFQWFVPDSPTATAKIRVLALRGDNITSPVAEDVSDQVFEITPSSREPTRVSGTIASNTTWSVSNSPYEVVGHINVAPGVTLTIEPGVTVRFDRSRHMVVNGALVANGTSSNPITFTANSANPTPGFWNTIELRDSDIGNTTVLNNCRFLYAHRPLRLRGNLTPTLANLSMSKNSANGIQLSKGTYSGDLTLSASSVPYVVTDGVHVHVARGVTMAIKPGVVVKFDKGHHMIVDGALKAEGTQDNPVIFTSIKDDSRGGDSNNDGASIGIPRDWNALVFRDSFIGNSSVLDYTEFYYGSRPIRLEGNISPSFKNITMEDNDLNGIQLSRGDYTANIKLTTTSVPYVVTGGIHVRITPGATMTLAAGVTVKLTPGHHFVVDGAVIADGTATNPIVFTSMRDDSHAGDTNNDGSSVGVPGEWNAVVFRDSNIGDTSLLNYCEFYFGSRPIRLEGNVSPTFTNLTMENNSVNGIQLSRGEYSTNIRLSATSVPYVILGGINVRVMPGVSMTVTPGAIFKFAKGHYFVVDGALKARGTPDAPIVFTSLNDDDRGGDTNGNGPSIGLPSDWNALVLRDSNIGDETTLDYCQFYFAGSPIRLEGNITPKLRHLLMQNNSFNAVRLSRGDYTSNLTLNVTSVPYIVAGGISVHVREGVTMTIDPGVTLKFTPGHYLTVSGALQARGTQPQPIILTSYRDDAHGGDTNNDGNTTPIPGDWSGIRVNDSTDDDKTIFQNCRVLYAWRGLMSNSAGVKIENSTFSEIQDRGVSVSGNPTPDLGGGARGSSGGNIFLGFERNFAVVNESPADVYAKFNYWGTTDSSEIAARIYDRYDNASKGFVFFQPFSDMPVPVDLITFEALPHQGSIELRWVVSSEKNILEFEIERGEGRDAFSSIGFVPAVAMGSGQKYRFMDKEIVAGRTYFYRLKQMHLDGSYEYSGVIETVAAQPEKFYLSPNFPNPFNPKTRMDYTLPTGVKVRIDVFNVLGKKVRTLVEQYQQPGFYSVIWDAKDDYGSSVPGGVYVVSMRAEGFVQTRKILFLR